ncbi:MAG: sulfur carrier protein ThiS [Desulfohalobiaceae bacterium]
MTIIINGKQHDLQEPVTLDRLLRGLGIDPKTVAVERNRTIVSREDFDAETVRDGDVIEVIRLVGGG